MDLTKRMGLVFLFNEELLYRPPFEMFFNELQKDIGITPPNHGCLTNWAKQGVLLLNAVLTVRAGEAHSHQRIGWEQFTNEVIQTLNEKNTPIVYILWGRAAQLKEKLIDTKI